MKLRQPLPLTKKRRAVRRLTQCALDLFNHWQSLTQHGEIELYRNQYSKRSGTDTRKVLRRLVVEDAISIEGRWWYQTTLQATGEVDVLQWENTFIFLLLEARYEVEIRRWNSTWGADMLTFRVAADEVAFFRSLRRWWWRSEDT